MQPSTAESIDFLTAAIGTSGHWLYQAFEPGANDHEANQRIQLALQRAVSTTQPWMPSKSALGKRLNFLQRSSALQTEAPPWVNWWDDVGPLGEIRNGSSVLVNDTTISSQVSRSLLQL